MYALKFVGKEGIHNYALGNEYHIQRENVVTSESVVAIVNGVDREKGWEVKADHDAYITTIEGKTVEVIHRIAWPH